MSLSSFFCLDSVHTQEVRHQWTFEHAENCSQISFSRRPVNLMAMWALKDGTEKGQEGWRGSREFQMVVESEDKGRKRKGKKQRKSSLPPKCQLSPGY